MKVLFSVGLIFAISQVGAFAQYSGGGGYGGPPGGGSGGGSAPQSPASFTVSQIGPSNPISDRLLAQTVPGSSQMPANFDGSVPRHSPPPNQSVIPMITISASTWTIGYKVYDTQPPYGVLMTNLGGPVFSGSGSTGSWNGTDPGWTILPNGNQAGGYGQFAMQIVLDLGYTFYIRPSPVRYEYTGSHTFFYGVAGAPSEMRSTIVPWSAELYRSVQ